MLEGHGVLINNEPDAVGLYPRFQPLQEHSRTLAETTRFSCHGHSNYADKNDFRGEITPALAQKGAAIPGCVTLESKEHLHFFLQSWKLTSIRYSVT